MSRLAYLRHAYRLKDRLRTGWALRDVGDPESVADHAWGTALLCLLFAEDAGVDRSEAIEIALVHDLAEAETGDLPTLRDPEARPVSATDKAALETGAMDALTRTWSHDATDAVRARWQAYEDRSRPAARFVRDMNLIDMALQALLYREASRAPDDTTLDEFVLSAEERVETAFGRALLADVAEAYRSGSGGRLR